MTAAYTTLDDWLAHTERQHPIAMDLSLERTVEVKNRLGLQFKVPVITVAPTATAASSRA